MIGCAAPSLPAAYRNARICGHCMRHTITSHRWTKAHREKTMGIAPQLLLPKKVEKGPWPLAVMRTERVLLRPWTREDVDSLHALWTAPEVRRYLWDDVVITRDTAEKVVESHLDSVKRHGIGYWALHILPAISLVGAPIAGFCGFRFIGNGPEIELMYGLRPEYWGRGLATEACIAALEFLWRSTKLTQVHARTDPPNEKSVQVMLRLGMTHMSTTESMITYVLRRPG